MTANTLRRLLPPVHRITVVEQSATFHMGAVKPWVMLGHREPSAVTHPLRALAARKVEVIPAVVEGIDPASKTVQTSQGSLRADFLVIALGADLNPAAIEGLAEAHTFYTLDGAVRLRDALRDFPGGDVVLLVPRTPFKCPPAPYEAAMLLHDRLRSRGIRDRCRLAVHTLEGSPMATAGPEMGAFIRGELESRGIEFHPGKRTKRVDGDARRIVFDDDTTVGFDLLIAVPPHEAPRVVREAGLTNQTGWIPVDPRTLAVAALDGVFAIGDVTSVPLPGRFKPDLPLFLPKAGTMADGQGRVVAERIAARILGRESEAAFDGAGFCFIETGSGEAVRGDGFFFETPHPRMRATPSESAQLAAKEKWISGWLTENLQEDSR